MSSDSNNGYPMNVALEAKNVDCRCKLTCTSISEGQLSEKNWNALLSSVVACLSLLPNKRTKKSLRNKQSLVPSYDVDEARSGHTFSLGRITHFLAKNSSISRDEGGK